MIIKQQLKDHIFKMRATTFLAVLFLVASVACLFSSAVYSARCYNAWLSYEGRYQQSQVRSIERAISLRPKEIGAYEKILDIYLQDDSVAYGENEAFRALLNKHQKNLVKLPQNTAQLYRKIAFACIAKYEGDAETRLRKSFEYFARSEQLDPASGPDGSLIRAYLTLSNYYAEYIWVPGTLKQPDADDITSMIDQFSSMLRGSEDSQREAVLAYACCLADLIDRHGQMWIKKTSASEVDALTKIVKQQAMHAPQNASESRLQKELLTWIAEDQG